MHAQTTMNSNIPKAARNRSIANRRRTSWSGLVGILVAVAALLALTAVLPAQAEASVLGGVGVDSVRALTVNATLRWTGLSIVGAVATSLATACALFAAYEEKPPPRLRD